MKAKNKFTNVVSTLGLVSKEKDTLRELVEAGANVFRLNFSHGTHESHLEVINNIKALNQELEHPVAIMLDTKGPEIRSGMLKEPVELHNGDTLTFTIEQDQPYEVSKKVSVSYRAFIDDVAVGDTILVEAGLMTLKVTNKTNTDVICQVLEGGQLTSTRHLTLPGKKVTLESITEQDKDDIRFGVENGIDMIALSFVRSAEDIKNLRKFLHELGANDVMIISKIENFEAYSNMEEIIRENDAVMIARGDLGADMSLPRLPKIQKEMIYLCNKYARPVIVATEMLESMINNPLPTRAEITDVYTAVYQGADCVMLSGESAKGKYPKKAVETLSQVALEAEKDLRAAAMGGCDCGTGCCCGDSCQCGDECKCGDNCQCGENGHCAEGCHCQNTGEGKCQCGDNCACGKDRAGAVNYFDNGCKDLFKRCATMESHNIWDEIAKATFAASVSLHEVVLIVTLTKSGNMARKLSICRPLVPVVALTNNARTQRNLQLSRGVIPYLMDLPEVDDAKGFARVEQFINQKFANQKGKKYLLVTDLIAAVPTLQVREIR